MGEYHAGVTDGNAFSPSSELMEKLATPPARPAVQPLSTSSIDEPRPRRPGPTRPATSRVRRKDGGWLKDVTRWLFENQTSK